MPEVRSRRYANPCVCGARRCRPRQRPGDECRLAASSPTTTSYQMTS